jgi:hypothetical protein
LNKVIKHMQYHLLIFMDILRKHNGKFFTKLDMSMQRSKISARS